MRGCSLTRLGAFEQLEDPSALRELILSGNEWGGREDGAALLEVLEGAQALEVFEIDRDGLSDGFVEDVLAGPAGQTVRRLGLTLGRHGTRADLEALLAWDRLPEVELAFTMWMPGDDALIARAEATGCFIIRPPNHRGRRLLEARAR